ncbi:Sip1 protein [Saccharomycopsis crataegensis]|uniref:Sip1 protein n=1 Tax=Saccharomycopsis crataegensis TaxID=43959 RepID=A0AAV5QN19_9ASCO|nr:Sip1 protein [Saccharomycopsis crataegensis]
MGNNPSTTANSSLDTGSIVASHNGMSPKRKSSRRTSNFIGAGRLKQARQTGTPNLSGPKNIPRVIANSSPAPPTVILTSAEASGATATATNKTGSPSSTTIAEDKEMITVPGYFKNNYVSSDFIPTERSKSVDSNMEDSRFDKYESVPSDEFIEHAETMSDLRHSSATNSVDLDDQLNNNTIHDDIINKEDDEIEANVLLDYMDNDDEYQDITVPVAIRWKGSAHEVFVVGSFTNWMNKIKLNQISPGEFAVQLFLRIGYYRFQFIVDGEIKCSSNLPKATEANGNFVNWFEVVKHDPAPVKKPLQHYTGKFLDNKDDDYFGPIADKNDTSPYQQQYTVSSDMINEYYGSNSMATGSVLTPIPRKVTEYTNEIPSVYIDTDDFDETTMDSSTMLKYKKLPEPPSLPPYLNNVLLNKRDLTAMPSVDSNTKQTFSPHSPRNTPTSNPTEDTNLLSVPNHVILNHLITTSIKNNVLAVACINRYAGKFITQVTYSPIDLPADS